MLRVIRPERGPTLPGSGLRVPWGLRFDGLHVLGCPKSFRNASRSGAIRLPGDLLAALEHQIQNVLCPVVPFNRGKPGARQLLDMVRFEDRKTRKGIRRSATTGCLLDHLPNRTAHRNIRFDTIMRIPTM